MKLQTIIILTQIMFLTQVAFAELHTPDTLLTTEESLFQQEINIRSTATAAHRQQAARKQEIQNYQPQDFLPEPEPMFFQQALYPVVYYQPPAWQVQAWQQQQAALRLATYYPPAPAMFPMFEPEPNPTPVPTPQPTATPQPTPTPIVQRVIEERVIVYVTPTPILEAKVQEQETKKQEAQAQHIEQLTAESEKARQNAVLWLSVFISFCVGAGVAFVYLLAKPDQHQKED